MKKYNVALTKKQQKSALSLSKTDRYQYLTVGETLPIDQRRITEQAKFTYSPLVKAIKTIAEQEKKQVEALEVLKPNVQKFTIIDVIPETTLIEKDKNDLNKI